MGGKNLGELLAQSCARWRDQVAVEDTRQSIAYSQLDDLSSSLARKLEEGGLEPHEPAIVLVSNQAADWVSVLALWRAGGVMVPVHRTTPGAAFRDVLERTGARFVLDASGLYTPLDAAGIASGTDAPFHVLDRQAPKRRPLLEGAAFIVFTSGSTGRPKGTVISHEAFTGKLETLEAIMRFSPETRSLLVLQITFSFGLWVSLLTLLAGGSVVMREKFEILGSLQTLNDARITTAALVPTMLRAVFGSKDASVEDELRKLESARTLKQLILGGEALDPLVEEGLRRRFPEVALFDVYGTTETATSDFILRPEDHPARRGTIGTPSPGVEHRVLDDDGRPVGAGGLGELHIRSRFAMNGYLDEPELTRHSFREGYFRTGDLVRVRDDGFLQMAGRNKEIISRGANKVSPLEVEAALLAHPAVSEAIVTGVPDPLMGERIHGLVVPIEGAVIDAQALRDWVGSRIDKFKVPDVIHFGAEIPRGRTGKADRAQLRRTLAESSKSNEGEGA